MTVSFVVWRVEGEGLTDEHISDALDAAGAVLQHIGECQVDVDKLPEGVTGPARRRWSVLSRLYPEKRSEQSS